MHTSGRTGQEGNDRGPRPVHVVIGGIGIALILILVLLLRGGGTSELGQLLSQLEPAPSGNRAEPIDLTPDDSEYISYVAAVLEDLNLLWSDIFSQSGLEYHLATPTLFRGFVESACGGADQQVGPHYCPAGNTIYLEEGFFDVVSELRLETDTENFVEAYILAHEVGHHVQSELGIIERVSSLQRSDPGDADTLLADLELQADCFAGVWAFRLAQQGIVLGEADIEETLAIVATIGEDRVRTKTSGMINAETWTHGSPEQRLAWFTVGYRSGDPGRCNTFGED